MSAVYQIRTYTPAGTLVAIITDALELSYKREVNAPGVLMFALPANHLAIQYLELDSQVEVWRCDTSAAIDWYCDFRGLWRGEVRESNQDGSTIYRATCPGQMHLLQRSIVGYKANTSGRNTFISTPAETICKELVRYNCTSSGTTADGRVRTVTTVGISIETDSGGGVSLDYVCAWQYLLPCLQEVARIGSGDFDLVKTGSRTWEYRWYEDQLGTDRSNTVTFALQYGNMANPRLTRGYVEERTVAIVGGQGEESDREVVVRTGTNYNATENAVETFVDARQLTVTASLESRGDAELEDTRQRNVLEFDVLQVPLTLYGRHYFLGDRVTGYYEGIATVQKITSVTVSLQSTGEEIISVELTDV